MPVEPILIGGVKAGVDPLVDGTVVEADTGVVLLEAGGVLWVAFPPERSIRPTLGDTSGSVLAAAAEALDPSSEPQAASPNVTRVHRRTLRAARTRFVINHYPGYFQQSPGQRSFTRAFDPLRSPAAIRMTAIHCWFAGNPAISNLLRPETGGFASPPCGGFALALWGQ